MKRSWAVLAILISACSSAPASGDVVGPFTGDTHRFAVDRLVLATSSDMAMAVADDLDGDGKLDNQLGTVFSALTSTGDATSHAADMVASGAVASSLEVVANSLDDDPSVGATFFGSDGAPAVQVGGKLVAGAFASNRAATTHHPGEATVALPIFESADPLVLHLQHVEIDFQGDGGSGLDVTVRGAVPIDEARAAATHGILQMITNDPVRHLVFARSFDENHDGVVTEQEIGDSSVVGAFLVADLHAWNMLSVAFSVHVVPCESGRCAGAPAADPCHDRVKDGGESDVDCSGPCALTCAPGLGCGSAGDCISAGCAGGTCRAASCSDGVRDGIESDADCGLVTGCALCASGKTCVNGMDCASGSCSNPVGTTGTCQ